MRNFIKNTGLLLIILNLFSSITFAKLETDNNIDIGNSTGVIIPLPESEKDIFNDVEKNSWYENAVNWGFENKIVAGTGKNTFSPMNALTREQLCVMLYNYTKHIGAEIKLADISSYSDSKAVSDWAREGVSWAVQEKIVTGKGSYILAPKDSATRAEAAAVIRRYTEKIGEDKNE